MNIIFIDIDALRPDHLGCYGHDLATPNIDALAGDGTVFERAYAADTPSLPSRASMVTGRYGVSNGVVTHGPDAYEVSSPHTWPAHGGGDAYRTLPELFFDERMRTVGVVPDVRHPAPWLAHVWHELHQPQESRDARAGFMSVPGNRVADTAIDALPEEDAFLHAQFWDAHAPYPDPPAVVEPVEPAAVPMPTHPTADQIAGHDPDAHWPCDRDFSVDGRDDLARLLADYDTAVRTVDHHVGTLLDHLKAEGRYDDACIVLTADHGEAFGEHGVYREHWSTHEPTQRVPLIVKPPAGVSAADRVKELVTTVDIAPTLADMAGIEPPAAWQGRSLRPLVAGDDPDWRDHVVLGHGLYTAQRAVREDRWKLIRTHHPGTWEDRLPELALYDMENDPHEQEDVSGDHPDVVRDLLERLDLFVDRHVGRDGDPLMDVARDGPIGSTGALFDAADWRGP